jgi:glycogen synthase
MQCWVLTNEYSPFIIGGLGIVATHLARSLVASGVHVTVLTQSLKPQIQASRKQNLHVVRFPRISKYYSLKHRRYHSRTIAAWMAQSNFEKPDILHIHSVQFTKTAQYLKKKFNVPVIYTCHSLVIMEKLTPVRSLVARQQEELFIIADSIVVPSKWLKNKIEQHYPRFKNKLHVIENGVHVTSTGGGTDRHHLLNVGRLVRSKGIEKLLHAVSILSIKHSRVTLNIVGTGTSTYRKRLLSLARKHQITSRIRWLGFKKPEQVQKLYSSYGAVVVPSPNESFGLVALEALANNVPLVSTRSGGLSEFVTSDVAEVIHQVKGEDIALAIENMWKNNELTNQRVVEGRKLALKYTWSNVAARYHRLFRSIS